MNQFFQNKVIKIFIQSIVFIIVTIILYMVSIINIITIGAIIVSIGNWFLHNIFGLDDLKFFVDKVDINKITLFFRYEQVMAGPQFTFVSNDFMAHFIFPIIFFIGLVSIDLINNFKNIQYYIYSIIGFGFVIFYYIFKILILGYHNSLKIIVFHSDGTIKSVENGQGNWFYFIELINNIINVYGSITLRLIFVLAVWIILFRFKQIKSKLLKEI